MSNFITQKIFQEATTLYELQPSWITFAGAMADWTERFLDTAEARAAFQKTDEYRQIQEMAASLPRSEESIRVVTVRIPASLHETIRHEAELNDTSMNTLCIAKLLAKSRLLTLPAARRFSSDKSVSS